MGLSLRKKTVDVNSLIDNTPDTGFVDVNDLIDDGGKKKSSSTGVIAPIPTSAPATSALPSPLKTNDSFGGFPTVDANINNAPVVTTSDGVQFPVNHNSPYLATPLSRDLLQQRVLNKTATPEDVQELSLSSGKSLAATEAYVNGDRNTGSAIDVTDSIAKTNNDIVTGVNYLNEVLKITGTSIDPNEVLASPDKSAALLQSIKDSQASAAKNKSLADQEYFTGVHINDLGIAEKPTQYIPVDAAVSEQENKTTQALNYNIKKLTVAEANDKGYTPTQTADLLYQRLDPTGYAQNQAYRKSLPIEQAKNSALAISSTNPIASLVQFSDWASNKDELNIQTLNAERGQYELEANRGLQSLVVEKKAQGIVNKDQTMIDAADALSSKVQDENSIVIKYPLLMKEEMAQYINKRFAEDAGVLDGTSAVGLNGQLLSITGLNRGVTQKYLKEGGYYDKPEFKDYADEVISNPATYLADNSDFGGVGVAFLKPFKSIFNTVEDLTGVRSMADRHTENVRDEMFPSRLTDNLKENISFDAPDWLGGHYGVNVSNTINGVANLGGYMAVATATGGLGTEAGLAANTAERVAAWSSFGMDAIDGGLKEADKMGLSPAASWLYAGMKGAMMAEGGRLLEFNKATPVPVIAGVNESIAKAAVGITDKTLAQDGAKELIDGAANAWGEGLKKYAIGTVKGAGVMSAFGVGDTMLKVAFGDPNVNTDDLLPETAHAFFNGLLTMGIMGTMGIKANIDNAKNSTYKGMLTKMIDNHDAANDAVQIGFEKGLFSTEDRDQKLAVINTGIKAKATLTDAIATTGVKLTPEQRSVWIANATVEKSLRNLAESDGITETEKNKYTEQADNLKDQNSKVLDGLTFDKFLVPKTDIYNAQKELQQAQLDFANNQTPENEQILLDKKAALENISSPNTNSNGSKTEEAKAQTETNGGQVVDENQNGAAADTAPLINSSKENITQPIELSPIGTSLAPEIIDKLGNQVSTGSDEDAINYATDKISENPLKLKADLGEDLYNKLLQQTPTEKLQEGLDYLIKNNSDDPNVDVLDKIISNRESANTINANGVILPTDAASLQEQNNEQINSNLENNKFTAAGGNKIVDKEGQPLELYHSTFEKPRPFENGISYFAEDKDYSQQIAKTLVPKGSDYIEKRTLNTIPVNIKAERVYELPKGQEMNGNLIKSLLKDPEFTKKYDAVKGVDLYSDNKVVYAVFYKNNIREVNNEETKNTIPNTQTQASVTDQNVNRNQPKTSETTGNGSEKHEVNYNNQTKKFDVVNSTGKIGENFNTHAEAQTKADELNAIAKNENATTSIKNAVTDFQREQLNLPVANEALEKDFGTTWDEAKKKIEDGYNVQDLIDELKKKARPLTDVENALLLHQQNTKEIQLIDANKLINEGAESNDAAKIEEGKIRKARLLDELQDIYNVDKAAGTENARGLSSRRMMVDRKYSLTNMIAEKRASANDGKPLDEAQMSKIEALHEKIKETEKALADHIEQSNKEIKDLQEKILSNNVRDKKSAAEKLRQWADDLEKKTKGQAFASIIPVTPKMIAGAMRLIATGLEKGGDLLELIKKAVDEIKSQHPNQDEENLRKEISNAAINAGITDKKAKKQLEDYSKIVNDRKELKLRADANRAKDAADFDLKKDEQKMRTKTQKVQDAFVKWQRAFKLSNPITIAKLTVAGATRLITTPAEDIVGGIYSKAIPKLAKGAIGEGGGLHVKELATAYKDGILEGMKDSAAIMKKSSHGKSDLDAAFGGKNQLPPEAIDFFGQLHSATKAPFKRAIFERSLSKRLRNNIANGVDVSDPLVQSEIAIGAYKDANRAIFMQDNAVSKGWQNLVNSFEKVDPKTGKAYLKPAATALKWLIPFVKVPTNIAAEIGTGVYGVPVGATKLVHAAFTKGLENLSSDEKDIILRNLKKGTLGIGALALGYFNPQTFGGYYQDKEHRKQGDAKAGALKMFGVDVPAWWIESPIFQVMQLGATVRRVKDAKVHGKENGISEGVWAGALGLADKLPMVDQPSRIFNAIKDVKERKYYVDELIKNTAEPSVLQKIAEWKDPETHKTPERKRNPQTLTEHLKMGIPGLREQVPLRKH